MDAVNTRDSSSEVGVPFSGAWSNRYVSLKVKNLTLPEWKKIPVGEKKKLISHEGHILVFGGPS